MLAKMGRPTVSAQRVERAARLVERGISVSEAALTCGVHRNTLGRYGVQRSKLFKQTEPYKPTRPEYRPYGDTMMDVLLSAIPDSTPLGIKEEIAQQLAVEILSGEKVFRLLRERAIEIKRKVNRTYHNRFQFQSIDQPMGDSEMTLMDVLEG